MKTLNDRLLDIQIAHAFRRLKYSDSEAARFVKLLSAADAAIVKRITERLALIEERGLDYGPATTARLQSTLDEIRVLNENVYAAATSHLTTQLTALAAGEAAFQTKTLDTLLEPINYFSKSPSPEKLEAIAKTRPMAGKHLASWASKLSADRQTAIEDKIREGLVQGRTTAQIVRDIRGTKAAKYTDGVLQISRNSATTLVRTAVNHIANEASQLVYSENPDVVKGYRWVSTLDLRTSSKCQELDGKIFKIGKGPMPPAHANCRSTTVAVTKSWQEMGLDGTDLDPEFRASMNGQVPAKLTWSQWIMTQSEASQNKTLGKGRAELLRAGKISFAQLFRPDGSYVTLENLYG